MSTRSRIGIQKEDGTIESVYCHFDGYLAGVGKTLLEHYTTKEQVEDLIKLGGISILGTHYDEALSKLYWEKAYEYPMGSPEQKEIEELTKDLTITYSSRGEDEKSVVHQDEADYLYVADNSWANYVYLYRQDANGWNWYVKGGDYEEFTLLKEVL